MSVLTPWDYWSQPFNHICYNFFCTVGLACCQRSKSLRVIIRPSHIDLYSCCVLLKQKKATVRTVSKCYPADGAAFLLTLSCHAQGYIAIHLLCSPLTLKNVNIPASLFSLCIQVCLNVTCEGILCLLKPTCTPSPDTAEQAWICHSRSRYVCRLSPSAISLAGEAVARSCLLAKMSMGTPFRFSSSINSESSYEWIGEGSG